MKFSKNMCKFRSILEEFVNDVKQDSPVSYENKLIN